MVKDGRADAAILCTGVPYASVLELASAIPLRMIPFTEEEMKKCLEAGPYAFDGEILQEEYEFVSEPVRTLTTIQNILISPNVSEDVAYRLTKAIVETWDEVVKTVPAAGKVSPLEDFDKSVLPLHPGAIKYYEEQGLTIPDDLRP